MEDYEDIPAYIKRGRAILVFTGKAQPTEWYFLLQDQSDRWLVFGVPHSSSFHKLGYDFLCSQLSYSFVSTRFVAAWAPDFLPDGTDVTNLTLTRHGIRFLCNLWERYTSEQTPYDSHFAEIPF
jgi:hypothetical protein